MRTIIDGKRIVAAAALLAFAGITLVSATALDNTDSQHPPCNADRGAQNEAVLDCVADEAAEMSASSLTLVMTAIAIACFVGSILLGASAIRRVMTLQGAAEKLQAPIGTIRRWVEEGSLENLSKDRVAVQLDPEQIYGLRNSLRPRG